MGLRTWSKGDDGPDLDPMSLDVPLWHQFPGRKDWSVGGYLGSCSRDGSDLKSSFVESWAPKIITCCVSGAGLNSLHIYLISSTLTTPWGDYRDYSLYKWGSWKFREVKPLSQSCTEIKWQHRDLNSCALVLPCKLKPGVEGGLGAPRGPLLTLLKHPWNCRTSRP